MFTSLRDVASRIVEIEGYPVKGVFFELHVETGYGTDDEALGHLEHTARVALYMVQRRVQ